MLRIYVAGASQELERAKAAMDRVRATEGLELAHDWTASIEANGGQSNPGEWTRERRRREARGCLEAVLEADQLWLLLPVPPHTTVGAWAELGAAWAFGQFWDYDIVASGPETALFDALAHEHYRTDEEAFQAILARTGSGA